MNSQATKRPGLITAICTFGFIGVLATIPMILSDGAKAIGSWYPPTLAISTIVGFICMVGLWKMKKWSLIAYTILVIASQVLLVTMGIWSAFSIAIPAIVIIIGFIYFKRMD